jgi:hypothetical protein
MKDCNTCFYNHNEGASVPCGDCFMFNKHVPTSAFVDKPKDVIGFIPSNGQRTVTGVKFDNEKPQWSLMQWKALSQVVDVLTYGAKKYAPDNWKKVPNARQRYIDAGFRHFTAYAAGEKNDSETGKSHLAHAICCLLFLLSFELGEDR